jgi:RHS repeat-associated protein
MSLGMDKRQPADNNMAYYYHFDGLGSVVALSNSYGNSCQSYEYSVYGQVAASDPNFLANPYMFTGRRFDIETGLYYYRARYYNPHIGRFMQTDPVGYGYVYCGNNPLNMVDPSGSIADVCDVCDVCDVSLVPTPNAPYFEFVDFKVTGWRGGIRHEIFSGSVKRTSKGIKVALKVYGTLKASYFVSKVIFDDVVPPTSPADVGIAVISAFNDVLDQAASAIDETLNDLDEAYRAFVRVRGYQRREGIWGAVVDFFDPDDWDAFWPENTNKGWCEVMGGTEWEDLIGGYATEENAFDAIAEAWEELQNPRPDFDL